MERIAITGSTNVVAVGYDEGTQTLEVEFPGEKLYQYEKVPMEVAEALVKAESIGKYLHLNIKGKFECKKVEYTP